MSWRSPSLVEEVVTLTPNSNGDIHIPYPHPQEKKLKKQDKIFKNIANSNTIKISRRLNKHGWELFGFYYLNSFSTRIIGN